MRWRWRIALGLAALPVVAAGALYAAIDSAPVRAWLKQTIETAVSTPGEMELRLDDLGPGLPGRVTTRGVSIADREGVWLRADEVALDWNPWALLGGAVEIESLTVARVDVMREPLPSPADAAADDEGADAPFALPEPPGWEIAVGRLSVPEIVLGETLLGEAARYALSGRADLDENGAGDLQLDLVRLDGPEGRLTVTSDVDLGSNTLAIDATLAEDADGLVVTLMGLEPKRALSINLAAEGMVGAFTGSLSAVLAEAADLEADFDVTLADEGPRLKLEGRARPGGLLDEETAGLIGETVAFRIDAALAEALLTLGELHVASDIATVDATGTADLDGGALDLGLRGSGAATAALRAMVDPASFETWDLEAKVGGTIDAPAADARIVVTKPAAEGMAAESARLDLVVAAPEGEGPWNIDGRLALDRPDVGDALGNAQLGTAPWLALKGTVDQAFETIDMERVELDMAAGHLAAALAFDGRSGDATIGGLTGDLPLAPFAPLVGLELDGRMSVTGDVAVSDWGESAEGSLRLGFADLTTGEAVLDAVAGATPDIGLEISGGADRVRIEAATLDLPIWTAEGTVDLDIANGTMSGTFGGPFRTTPALAAEIDPALSAAGRLETTFSGRFDEPRVDLRLAIAKGAYDGFALDGGVLDVRELTVADGLTMTARLSLPSATEPIVAGAALTFDSAYQRLDVTKVQVAGPGLDLAGGMVVTLEGTTLDGRLAGRIADVEALGEALGLGPLKGRGVFEADLKPAPDGSQAVTARLWLQGLEAEGVAIGEMALAATVSDAMGTPKLDVEGSLSGINAADTITADRALLRVNGGLDALQLSVEARNRGTPGWSFKTAGEVALGGDRTTVTLATLDMISGEHRIAASQPLRLHLADGTIESETLVLAIDEGTLTADFSQGDDHLKGNIKLENVPVDIVALADPTLAMAGRIDGSGSFAFDDTSGQGQASFAATGLVVPGAATAEEATLKIDTTYGSQRLKLTAAVTGIEGVTAEINADWPLVFDHRTGNAEVPLQEAVSATVKAHGDVARLWQHLPVGDQLLSGDLDVALDVSGRAADPVVAGQAKMSGGRYENLEWGTIVDGIELVATASQEGDLNLTIDANDGGAGRISMEGKADLTSEGRLKLDAKLTLADAQIVRRDDAKVIAKGDLTFDGTLAGGDIKGRFETVEVEINVAQNLPGSVTVLDAQDVFDAKGQGQAAPIRPWRANLDIVIEMPRKVYVRGRGLESEWEGRIAIGGTIAEPLVNAQLDLVRGNLELIGRRFELTSGTVSLTPADDNDPRFSVVAAANSGTTSGQIEVSGRLSAPELKVTTVPSLPQDEALAQLLFGKGAGTLSGFEAVQLAGAIAEITGAGPGGSGILDTVRDTLGVDVLEVGTDDEGDPTIGAGRYISENVYVGVQQGTASGSSGVVVEVELTDNLSLETEAGADASGRVGVDWSWDY